MVMATTVDARGLSCPQPVILTRSAIQDAVKGSIEVLVETGTSRDNVSRMARKEGWQVEVREVEDGFKLILSR
jgi:tRNA 2-thiouridine synthesizing protein A